MVKIIVHRINKMQDYKDLDNFYGIETDIRDHNKKIVMSHDPFRDGEDFLKFLKQVDKTIFLNIKSSGLLNKVLKYIKKKKVFFLDISFSEFDFLYKQNLSSKILLRYSSYEKYKLEEKYFKKIKWIWFDFFNQIKITKKDYLYLRKHNKKICLVSPDLLGRNREILRYIKYLNKNKIIVDAVCTKKENAFIWRKNYNY